jgi:3-oxoacyl-[acyl-carrier-protein] synthase-3
VGQGWETEGEPNPKLHMIGGPRILRNAILTMAGAAERAVASADLDWDDVDIVIPHQANLRITQGLEKHLALARGRVIHNIGRYGNMSASTVGVTLDEVVRGMHGPVPEPATVVLTAIGGGYTTAAAVVRI